jgi:opacity protein-like surface antigen
MKTLLAICCSFVAILSAMAQQQSGLADQGDKPSGQETPDLSPHVSPWKGAVGDGFRKGAFEVGGAIGTGLGMQVLQSAEAHDFALSKIHFGWMFTDVLGGDRWYRGNLELMGELFAGAQYRPDIDYLVGALPVLRYNLATRSRWVPFVDGGAGISATSIRGTDLSTTFEYNLQGGGGSHYFVSDNVAVTLQYRWLHLSNAGIKFPNLGLNTSTIYLGVSWFF